MSVATWGKCFQLHCTLWIKILFIICFIYLEYTKDRKDKVGTCPGETINDLNKPFVEKLPFNMEERGIWNKGLMKENF